MCHPDAPRGAQQPAAVRTDEVEIPLDGATMPAYFAAPEGDGPHPAVILVGDIFGARTPFYEHLATLLAGEGFIAVVPEFFFRVGPLSEPTPEAAYARMGQLHQQTALTDLDQALTWVRERPDVVGRRVGTIGFCLGGTFVLDLAARRSDLATVCFYGFPGGPPGPPGDPTVSAPRPLDVVDDISGPILGFWGSEDERVGVHHVAAFAEALDARGVDFRHTVYPGLDHGFMAASFGSDGDGHEHAREAWATTLEYLRAET